MASVPGESWLGSDSESPLVQEAPSYPFPFVEQDDAHMATVRAELLALAQRHELFDDGRKTARAVECVLYYVDYCSPPAPPLADLRIAGRFLLAFIFLNDFNDGSARDVFPDLLRCSLAAWNGHPARSDKIRPAWLDMVVDLRESVALRARENDVPIATLLHLLRLAYSAFYWEWSNKGARPDPRTFEHYRGHTIFNKPWIELWRVLAGIDLGPLLPASPDLAEVETLAAEITYLVNDLASLLRDVEKDKPNIAFVVRDREGLSLAEAAREARRMHDRKVARFIELCDRLSAEAGSDALARHLDLMKIALRGNIQVLKELRRRYDALGAGAERG